MIIAINKIIPLKVENIFIKTIKATFFYISISKLDKKMIDKL